MYSLGIHCIEDTTTFAGIPAQPVDNTDYGITWCDNIFYYNNSRCHSELTIFKPCEVHFLCKYSITADSRLEAFTVRRTRGFWEIDWIRLQAALHRGNNSNVTCSGIRARTTSSFFCSSHRENSRIRMCSLTYCKLVEQYLTFHRQCCSSRLKNITNTYMFKIKLL